MATDALTRRSPPRSTPAPRTAAPRSRTPQPPSSPAPTQPSRTHGHSPTDSFERRSPRASPSGRLGGLTGGHERETETTRERTCTTQRNGNTTCTERETQRRRDTYSGPLGAIHKAWDSVVDGIRGLWNWATGSNPAPATS